TWEMISRLKYLGTMLFLHNFQQVFTWSLKIVSAARSALSVLTKPILGPILEVFEFTLPIWNLFAETIGYLSSVVMVSVETSLSLVIGTVRIIWFVFSTMLNIGMVAVTSHTIYFLSPCILTLIPTFCVVLSNRV